MRWDSPFVLAVAGTIAIHLILFVTADAIVVYNPYIPPKPAPRVEMVEVEVPPMIKAEPPPPIAPPEPIKAPETPPPEPKITKTRVREAAQPALTQPPIAEPNPVPDQPGIAGGEQVVTLDAAQTGGIGVPVAVGKRTSEKVGRGGAGGGTGAGSGSGAATAVPVAMSVATLKTLAKVKGDFGYFKEYPIEAQRAGIEGPIKVKLTVDETGKVRKAVLLNKLGHGLDEIAYNRALEIQFEPAIDTDNKPVASTVIWTFHMTLPK